MKILLVKADFIREIESKEFFFAKPSTPTLGINYLASILQNHGHKVIVLDSLYEYLRTNFSNTINVVTGTVDILKQEKNIECVGISITSPTRNYAIDIAKQVKEFNPEIKIIGGGPHITILQEMFLEKFRDLFDFLVVGEGDETLSELLNALEGKIALNEVQGIVYIGKGKKIKKTEPRTILNEDKLNNINIVPFTDYIQYQELFPNEDVPAISLVTTRGCPYRCAFCYSPHLWEKYREQSTERVLNEIEYLVEKYKVKNIRFQDDTFTFNKDRCLKIFSEIKERKWNVELYMHTRFDCIDKDIIEAYANAGGKDIYFGLESGSQKLRSAMNKNHKITNKRILEVCRIVKNYGLNLGLWLIFGYPGETEEDVRTTDKLINKIAPDEVSINLAHVHPHTQLFYHSQKIYKIEDWLYETADFFPYLRGDKTLKKYLECKSFSISNKSIRTLLEKDVDTTTKEIMMDKYDKYINEILKSLKCTNNTINTICSHKDICEQKQIGCLPGGALQMLLEIPEQFPKAILLFIDLPARVFQFVDYIGNKNTNSPDEGFTKEQYTAMLDHYGFNPEREKQLDLGKAVAISDEGRLSSLVSKLMNEEKEVVSVSLDFTNSEDKISQVFSGEKATAFAINMGKEVIPAIIIFHKDNENKKVENFIQQEKDNIKLLLLLTSIEIRWKTLGEFVSSIPEKTRGKFSQWLLMWRKQPDILWLGNKIWYIVDHTYIHVSNLWELLNQLHRICEFGNKLSKISKDAPLILALSVWLHDIGYKGFCMPDLEIDYISKGDKWIIEAHSVLSGGLILFEKDSYGLFLFDDKLVAKVALCCIYHQRNCPVTVVEYNENKENILIPKPLKENKKLVERILDNLNITVSNNSDDDSSLILEKIKFKKTKETETLKTTSSILRLLDACDFNINRVGNQTIKSLRKSAIKHVSGAAENQYKKDLKHLISKIREKEEEDTDEAKLLNTKLAKLQEIEKTGKMPQNQNDGEILDPIAALAGDSKRIISEPPMKLWYLGRHVGLLNQQENYHKIHEAVQSVIFKKERNSKINLEYQLKLNDYWAMEDLEKEILKEIAPKIKLIYHILTKTNLLKIDTITLKTDTYPTKSVIKNFKIWIDGYKKD